jgi:glyoxylase-like metal-dependent hydrolase (beta-lactamase superfamily II)
VTSTLHHQTLPDRPITIDLLHLGRPQIIAAYLLPGPAPLIVDPGPASCLPALRDGLAAHGLRVSDLAGIVLTHIHLDHAAATGQLVAEHPGLTVHVHQRGAPHLIDPSRLLHSAGRLYGDQLNHLWGTVLPVPAERIITYQGGEQLNSGPLMLQAYDAPGHARHHLVWFEPQQRVAFVGDNLGVRLPGLQLTRPATPPPEVDLPAWQRTHDLIAGLAPRLLALTHFGCYDDVAFHLTDARRRLAAWAEVVRQALAAGADEEQGTAALAAQLAADVESLTPAQQEAFTRQTGALTASWRGLARYWLKAAGSS